MLWVGPMYPVYKVDQGRLAFAAVQGGTGDPVDEFVGQGELESGLTTLKGIVYYF